MLKFDGDWRFEAPNAIPKEIESDFLDLIGRVASQGSSRKEILEHFKYYFARAEGITTYHSSSESWAESDLRDYMCSVGRNAPLFIEAFYDACQDLEQDEREFTVPSIQRINRILTERKAGYEIRPPHLIMTNSLEVIPASGEHSASEHAASLDKQAFEQIQEALAKSEKLLAQGHDRPAVQEILWLLETVTTVFRGMEIKSGTIQGKYFNKIVGELRQHYRGSSVEQVLKWIDALHGFLSSPTGGGIRHGIDLKEGIALRPGEARLYCNLIRNYISFLLVSINGCESPTKNVVSYSFQNFAISFAVFLLRTLRNCLGRSTDILHHMLRIEVAAILRGMRVRRLLVRFSNPNSSAFARRPFQSF